MTTHEKLACLDALHAQWEACTACPLSKHRRRAWRGFGNPDAAVMFVLDRPSLPDVTSAEFKQTSPYLDILWELLRVTGNDPASYWYTPATLCPTLSIRGDEWGLEAAPTPKAAEVAACRRRLCAEVSVVEPELLVACGPLAARALRPKDPVSLQYDCGRVVEAQVQGTYVEYPVPMLLVPSMHQLHVDKDTAKHGVWGRTYRYLLQATDLGGRLASAAVGPQEGQEAGAPRGAHPAQGRG